MTITETIKSSFDDLKKLRFIEENMDRLDEPKSKTLELMETNQISKYFKTLNVINDLKASIMLMDNSLELLRLNGINQEPLKSAKKEYFIELYSKYVQLYALTDSYDFTLTYSKNLANVYVYTDELKAGYALRLTPLRSLKGSKELQDVVDMRILHYLIKYNEFTDAERLLSGYDNKEYILELSTRIRKRLKEK